MQFWVLWRLRETTLEKVEGWIEALKTLAKFAQTQPHAAFAVFTHCLQGCWTFLCRTVPGAGFFLQALEDCIRRLFIPALLKRDVSDNERDLLSSGQDWWAWNF